MKHSFAQSAQRFFSTKIIERWRCVDTSASKKQKTNGKTRKRTQSIVELWHSLWISQSWRRAYISVKYLWTPQNNTRARSGPWDSSWWSATKEVSETLTVCKRSRREVAMFRFSLQSRYWHPFISIRGASILWRRLLRGLACFNASALSTYYALRLTCSTEKLHSCA